MNAAALPGNRRARRALRAILASNYRRSELDTLIVPALEERGVEVVATIACEPGQKFGVVERQRPNVVLVMTDMMGHSASASLAEACRDAGVPMRAISRSKATWEQALAPFQAEGQPAPTLGMLLKHEREGQGLSHRELGAKVGVDKGLVRAWELDREKPNSFALRKLLGLFRKLGPYLAERGELPADEPEEATGGATPEETAPPTPRVVAPPPAPPEPLPPPKTFGEALRRVRLAAGFSQDELGALVEVDGSSVSMWERDENAPIKAHYEALLGWFEELAHAPPPASREQEKPGPAPAEAKPATIIIEEDDVNEQIRVLEDNLAAERRARAEAEARLVEVEAALARADGRTSIEDAADALRRCVALGFMDRVEAHAKWIARLGLEAS